MLLKTYDMVYACSTNHLKNKMSSLTLW